MLRESPKKILFLVPVHISYESYVSPPRNARTIVKKGRILNSLATDLPLGLLSISAYLKKFLDLDVRLADFNTEVSALDSFDYPNFAEFAKQYLTEHFSTDFTPDIIGISSLFSPSYQNFIELGATVKAIWPKALLVGGGNIPTNSYHHIFQTGGFRFFDALCFGEGEKPMLDLLKAESPENHLASATSWITAEKLAGGFIPKHDFIVDLDEIPFYDYALCDHGRHSLNPVMTSYAAHSDSMGYHIMTSRGCPFHCTFCASHQVHGRKMRYHSTDRVFADIRRLVEQYSAKTLIFQDDHFMADKERVLSILKFIEQEKLNAIFQNGLTLYSLDYETLSAFKRAGVNQLVLPLESGSEKVLKYQMKKPLKMSISRQVTEDCRKLGIYTDANILIGLPGETRQDIEDARRNLRTIPANWYHVVCASPVVGSEIHKIASEKGYISGNVLGADYRTAVINTPDFSAEYIQDMQYVFNLELNFLYNSDLRLGELALAEAGFSNVLGLRPDHLMANLCLSYVQMKKGNEAEAAKHLARCHDPLLASGWEKYLGIMDLHIPSSITDVVGIIENKWLQ
ncbi:MAG: radical SAM protein [Zoogloeaceae bacterium]|nr:radical SAM protein [Zoogloeaceae bacterium]